MMKYLQKIGKSLMLPVAVLPAAGILYGIGYWIDPTGWGANSVAAAFLIKAASAIIDQIPLLFAIGVSVGMAKDRDGTSALAGIVAYLMMTTLLSTGAVAMYKGIDVSEVPAAFGRIQNAFIGILSGVIGSECYNRFRDTKLPDWLAFFSGKRCVAIVTAMTSIVVAVILYFIWPIIYAALVAFGTAIIGLGPVGAGIYAMLNRALIPLGLHHALNAVFWFDTAGINDLGLFWSGAEGAVKGVTGQYMTGFFPVMMFGLPGGALAMYHTAKDSRKKKTAALLMAGAFASFFTGITEPLEFSFMFLAPGLYIVHAVLTGIFAAACAAMSFRIGFNFSAGLVDWILSFKAPMAVNPWILIPVGLVASIVYYSVFRFVIVKFDLKTPGREDEEEADEGGVVAANDDFTTTAKTILRGLGGKGNIKELDYCATRIRTEINDYTLVDEKIIKSAGVAGVVRPSQHTVQVIVGPRVQFVHDEIKRIMIQDNKIAVASPVKGEIVPIRDVKDPVFSQETVGRGIAIMPDNGRFYAPADGTLAALYPTGHAFCIATDDGAELLIHIGLDTVKLNGKYFSIIAAQGQRVKKGDPIVEVDIDGIKSAGYEVITPVIVANPDLFSDIEKKSGHVEAGDTVLNLEKREM